MKKFFNLLTRLGSAGRTSLSACSHMRPVSLLAALLCAITLFAQEPSQADLVLSMNAAQRNGDYLGALVSATAILKQNKNHRIAKDFVHNNYQRMDQQARERISEIAFSEDAAELEEICEIYRKLNIINENLSEVEMPLHGGNKITGEWDWQPEIQYYRGHYDKARTRVFELYKRIAKAAVKESHFDAAYEYYSRALNTYLMSAEYPSQLANIVATCRETAETDSRSGKTDELVRAYSTYMLISRLDTAQNTQAEQQRLMPLIAESYVRDAAKLLESDLVTDWEQAYEYYQTALDWHTANPFVAKVNRLSSDLRKRIADYYISQGLPDMAKPWR